MLEDVMQVARNGLVALSDGDNERAYELFRSVMKEARALEDGQEKADVYVGFGLAASRLGRFAEAEEILLTALTLQPTNGKIAEYVGEMYMEADQPNEALNYFNRAQAMGVESNVLDYNRACMASRLGLHDQMLEALERAIALDEQNRDDALADDDFAPSMRLPALRRLLRLE